MGEMPTIPERQSPYRPKTARRTRTIATAIGTAIAAAIVALWNFGVFTPRAAQAHESPARDEKLDRVKTLDEKIDGIALQQADMAADVKDIKKLQNSQTTDIAVIKRQLGLDGLGPPPVHVSGFGR